VLQSIRYAPEQLAQAKKLAAARAAPFREVVRAKLTMILTEHPNISHAEAAKHLGLDRHAATLGAAAGPRKAGGSRMRRGRCR
jgi:hypothetical protein